MRNETRQAYNAYLSRIAELNEVPSAAQQFAVSNPVQQTLESKMQDTSDFLRRINVVPVTEQIGQVIGLGVSGPVAGRTDTTSSDRTTTDVSSMEGIDYTCKKTDYDTHIRYAALDMWAKFPDFQARLRDAILRRQALDRIMIGFNGTSAATATNKGTNPLLQDVNIGWIQKWTADKAANVMTGGATAGTVKIGATGDYKNLDALVYDVVDSLIDPWYREDPGLVVVVSRNLLADKYFPMINQTLAPSEQLSADLVISQKRMGGLQAVAVPFMPTNALMVTALDNLSIYYQEGARRRTVLDNPKRDRIENYESSNDAYVVEDYGRGCVVKNIAFV
ncbi:MAG: phage major capsid protein, P2 family [Proteobacteria bacterium]|nr:phage major capsid protein, P2 family [Pseudomonadota bacterium]